MRGRKKEHVVRLDESEMDRLRQVVSSRKAPYGQVRRARIVLTCGEHPDWSDRQVAEQVGCCDRTVRKWRKRWKQTRCLEEAPRSGRPRVFSPGDPGSGDGFGVCAS